MRLPMTRDQYSGIAREKAGSSRALGLEMLDQREH